MFTHIRQALESLELFSDLPPEQLDALARFSSLRTVRAGETIFCQNEPSPYCFGVVSGEVMIQRSSSDPRFPPKVLGLMGPGSIFGESAFFEESPRLAQASASRDGELIAIAGSGLREWVKAEPAAGVPLMMGLLRNSIERLHRTSHELSIVYGIGRLLGSSGSFVERLSEALDFLRSSLAGVDGILVYRRNPYWDELEPIAMHPAGQTPSSLPINHPLVIEATVSKGALALQSPAQRQQLAGIALPWSFPASAALVPLVDRDQPDHPLQGLILVASQADIAYFATERLLVLSAIADPFAEALSRHRRDEDAQAQSRLQKSREKFPR